MEYIVLWLNKDNTARVQMTIDGHVLAQDFDLGASPDDLKNNIMQGMAVFQAEIAANQPSQPASTAIQAYDALIGKTVAVSDLPAESK